MYGLGLDRTQEIDNLAAQTLRNSGQRVVPVNPSDILNRFGVFQDVVAGLTDAEAVLNLTSPPYKLLLSPRRPDQGAASYNHRVRFTQAHEIGHFLMHKSGTMFFRENHRIRRYAAEHGEVEHCNRENEADAFAASLILPAEKLRLDLERLSLVGRDTWREGLARKYDVSHAALDRRIAWLRPGLLLSGEAFADSNKIDWISQQLNLSHRCPMSPEYLAGERHCSWALHLLFARPCNYAYEHQPRARSTTQICIRDVIATSKSELVGEVTVFRRMRDKFYFQMTL